MIETKQKQILAASGKMKAEYVLKNASIINVFTKEIIYGDIAIQDGMIIGIGEYTGEIELDIRGKYVCPGLIDSHVHIESTMVSPAGFAKMVVPCGTTTIIADPHEIANVCGLDGIEFMISQSQNLPLNIYFMLPSCVPATSFENNGAKLGVEELKDIIASPSILGLGEVMDYPAVIETNSELLNKIKLAGSKVVDGHSPHLTGKELNAYKVAGIDTDHECSTDVEALERIRMGMYVQIREASAARNVKDILKGLLEKNVPLNHCIFCTDDRHLDHIVTEGHIDHIIRTAIEIGLTPVEAICLATIQAAKCYGLKTKGAVAPGYDADLLILDNLENFKVKSVMIDGKWIVEEYKTKEELFIEKEYACNVKNTVNMPVINKENFKISLANNSVHVIQIIPGQIETNKVTRNINTVNGVYCHTSNENLCKIAVIERHKNTGNIGLGLIEGFGLKGGAIAQSIAHDSHNVMVIGDNDDDMVIAANHIANIQGGITIVSNGKILETLPLPIAGLMSDKDPLHVMSTIKKLNSIAKSLGIPDEIDPFLTLGFMALPVIPHIRITDQGLFDSKEFKFINLEA